VQAVFAVVLTTTNKTLNFWRHAVSPLQASTIAERGQLLNDYFTYSLYVNVCRSLFERHKLLLSFMLGVKTLQHGGSIDPKEWRFLLAGPSSTGNQRRSSTAGAQSDVLANPASDWLTEKSWTELLGVSQLPAFNGFDEHVAHNLEHYKAIFDSSEVSLVQSPARMLTSTTIAV
jgi:dynein heavy chain